VNHFQYKNNDLFCEDVSLETIADEVGTPTYVYSHATLSRHYRVFDEALAGLDHLIAFSVKANSNLAVLKLLGSLGAGADIVSGGELFRAQRAGIPAEKIVFSGVGKTESEMAQALEAGILAFNVESAAELRVLDKVSGQMGKRAPVSLRVNPNVDAETHPYISTGLKKNKFGIAANQARDAYKLAMDLPNLEVVGVDCHIGSQLTKTAPFTDAVARISELVGWLRKDGVELKYVDLGGGLGIPYGEEEEAEPPSPAEYGAAIKDGLAPLIEQGVTLICEPGRVIVGNAGGMLTRVLYQKSNEVKHGTMVDAAFNDLLRPALYQSFHPMRPVLRDAGRAMQMTDVVGPICESGDFLARDREMRSLEDGELISVGAAGAYGFTMASNYNTRPRAAEVLVKGDSYAVVRKRETLEQLIENESIPDFL
jgi:diaminopimelate decarboxylase